jgi:hypothetical protein
MAKKSILCLEETLWDLGYYPEHIESYIHTIDQILQQGIATIDRNAACISAPGILQQGIATIGSKPGMISAAGIRPLFKINPKSIDVFLITTGVLNLLRIFHPSNSLCKGESEAGCYVGNQKWLAENPWAKDNGPDRGFYFTNFKYITSDYSSSI